MWTFSSCGKWGLLFVAARELLIAVASLLGEHRLSSRGAPAQALRGIWDLPGLGTELISLELQGGFFTTGLPGEPSLIIVIQSTLSPLIS